MCPQKSSLVALPTQLVTRDRVFCQQIKTAFQRGYQSQIAQPIGVQPMIQKIVLTRVFKITNYGSCHMTMPMIHNP
jgi:hypothetical protein